ncbi:Ubiquitin carboxyl-terminal hydrolase MINDY-2 [Terramyces sp. JEL0728]|nr:Ubiquitin carboxyl-terminal hydrolase MINDY-2 [Terramyces sp. JEL0728]
MQSENQNVQKVIQELPREQSDNTENAVPEPLAEFQHTEQSLAANTGPGQLTETQPTVNGSAVKDQPGVQAPSQPAEIQTDTVNTAPAQSTECTANKDTEKFKCKQIAPNKCILLQNENGPCPLLALANLLSLANRIDINRDLSLEDLLNLLCQYILSIEITNANDEKILDDTLQVLPKLKYGMDVNIYFDGIHIEYTDLLSPFELLRIQIYHGWVIDPQEQYYKVVEEGIKDSVEGLVCREFLQQGQLTLAGMEALLVTIHEPCVFFYNNHFSVLTRNENKLYCLVTDEGYIDEDIVWQDLVLDGDCKFYNYDFQEYGTGNDDLLARQLQQQFDYEEAQIQRSEQIDERERTARGHERVGTESTSSSKDKKKDCAIQ